MSVKDESRADAGQVVATWDPHSHPVITEVAGNIKFIDLIDGSTMHRQTDELTGLTSIVVTDHKDIWHRFKVGVHIDAAVLCKLEHVFNNLKHLFLKGERSPRFVQGAR